MADSGAPVRPPTIKMPCAEAPVPASSQLGSEEHPIPYAKFVEMFKPLLLERYREQRHQCVYSRFAPIFYWQPTDQRSHNQSITTTVQGDRGRPVTETSSKIKIGKDVVALNILSGSKESWIMSLEVLHHIYKAPSDAPIVPPELFERNCDPEKWKEFLRPSMGTPRSSRAAYQCWEHQNWPMLKDAMIDVQQEMYPQMHEPIEWRVALPFEPDSDRRRIGLKLSYEIVKDAMAKQGVDYNGGALFRQESYNPKYRFTPRDFLIVDVRLCRAGYKPITAISPESNGCSGCEDGLLLTDDKKYHLKQLRKLIGDEKIVQTNKRRHNSTLNASSQKQRHTMVRTVDCDSFESTMSLSELAGCEVPGSVASSVDGKTSTKRKRRSDYESEIVQTLEARIGSKHLAPSVQLLHRMQDKVLEFGQPSPVQLGSGNRYQLVRKLGNASSDGIGCCERISVT